MKGKRNERFFSIVNTFCLRRNKKKKKRKKVASLKHVKGAQILSNIKNHDVSDGCQDSEAILTFISWQCSATTDFTFSRVHFFISASELLNSRFIDLVSIIDALFSESLPHLTDCRPWKRDTVNIGECV